MTALGTSFYKQCVPDNTLLLVCSTTALHYLSVRLVSGAMCLSKLKYQTSGCACL